MPYQLTPKRLAAARANLQKAYAAMQARKPTRPIRPSALKHGFYSIDLRKSVILLGEDVREYDEHIRRFERVFTPENAVERRIVQRLGEASWRLLRTYRTRGMIQTRRLREMMETMSGYSPLEPEQARAFALALIMLFCDEGYIEQCVGRLRNQIERLLRMYLLWRTGSDKDVRTFTHVQIREWAKVVEGSL